MSTYDVNTYPANRDPFSWVTENTRKFMDKGYLDEGVTTEQRALQIVDSYRNRMLSMGYPADLADFNATILRKGLEQGHVSFSTPAWVSYGLSKGLAISCFGSDIGNESMEDILFSAGEIGMLTKYGGGTSINLNKLRARGTPISVGGKADGAAHFASLFNAIMKIARQGEARRGYCAAYLNADHGDIEEFLDIGRDNSELQNITTAVIFPEGYLAEAAKGDMAKQEVIVKTAKVRSEIGYPYIGFHKNMNAYRPQCYVDRDMTVDMSNLCMVGSDRVVSSDGYLTAEELYNLDKELVLFDGDKPVSASKMKLREENADTYTITLDNGMQHTVTSYHGIPVMNSRGNSYTRVKCKDLKIGDKVPVQTSKGLFGSEHMPKEAFLLGLYQSDGTQHKDTIMLDIWENDFDIIPEVQEAFNYVHTTYNCDKYDIVNQSKQVVGTRTIKPATFYDCTVAQSAVRKKRLASKTLHKALNFQKGFVPSWIWEADEETQWQYVRGLLIADGSAFVSTSEGNPIQIAYTDINREFLQELQLLFQNLGLSTSIRLLREAGSSLLPDGKGGSKYYDTKACYRLIVGNKPDALTIEKHTGFLSRKNITLEDREYRDNTKKAYSIVSIEYAGKQNVYCPTVNTDEHIFIAQGMKTFNCSEILLPNGLDESFVCVLSSLNLVHYDEWKFTPLVQVMISFLDTLVEESIEKIDYLMQRRADEVSKSDDNVAGIFLQRIKRFLIRHRALGLGTMGLHHLYQSKSLPWESKEAAELNNEIFKHIRTEAETATTELAKLLGEPELCAGYGRRNTTLLAIAPTKSSASIMGYVSEAIQPELSNYYVADLAKDTVVIRNPYLTALLESKGKNIPTVWESILEQDSVQHLDFLTDHEKAVFKTFAEIPVRSLIDQAAIRQQYLDQTQSFNVMYHPDTPASEIVADIYYAEAMGLPTMYYQKSISPAQINNQHMRADEGDCLACSS